MTLTLTCSVLVLFLFVFCCICRSLCHPNTFLFRFLRVLNDDEVVINIDEVDLHHANYWSRMYSIRHLGIISSSMRTCDYFTSRIPHTPNSISTFNVVCLRLATSGDINPNPGPSITSFTANRNGYNSHRVHHHRNPLNGIRTHDLCDTGAVLYPLSYQANWELVIQ